ncbi:MAG: CBS domain-containing protein [Armatimonadota bacterium]|nr:CBS domain-containing protein [Armatimonadota bacterium]
MLTAGDIMTRDLVVVTPDMLVEEVGDLLTRYRIHGAPVVDKDGQLVGMISLVDLVGRVGETARDVMSPDPVTATEDTPLDEIAGMMLDQMVRRIPIVEGNRVVGIVSASDLIRVFLNLHEAAPGRAGEGTAPAPASGPAAGVPRPGPAAPPTTTPARQPGAGRRTARAPRPGSRVARRRRATRR